VPRIRPRRGVLVPLALLAVAVPVLAACSPTFGGSQPPPREVIIVPQGQTVTPAR
jgi:hypothetical protein